MSYLESHGLLGDDGDESDSSSSESEDEAEVADGALDMQLAQVIQSIRRKDPKIYDKCATWFRDEEATAPSVGAAVSGEEARRQKGKKVRYKDVVRQQILEDAEKLGHARPTLDGSDDDEDNGNDDGRGGRREAGVEVGHTGFAYDDQQRQLPSEPLSSVPRAPGDHAVHSDRCVRTQLFTKD